MNYNFIDEYLMSKAGVTKDFKEEWNWERYKIENKLKYITLKLNPIDGEFFRNEYEDIIPGYYMNKTHWNSVKANGEVPVEILKEILDKAYIEILNKLAKKKREAILNEI